MLESYAARKHGARERKTRGERQLPPRSRVSLALPVLSCGRLLLHVCLDFSRQLKGANFVFSKESLKHFIHSEFIFIALFLFLICDFYFSGHVQTDATSLFVFGCYMVRPFTHSVECCCVLLGVVAQSFY